MTTARPITVAYGDGIGPEIMEASLAIIKEAGAQLSIESIEVGESQYKIGHTSGISPSAWESLRRTKVLLKSPITTPQGGGYKSLNVTMRKTLGLYANVRPCVAYHPFVKTSHPEIDLIIVRENEEDLYAGIEYQQTPDSIHSIKLITRSGCERIVRYAFEYATRNGRKKITCMSKDNIMKAADGLFHRIFNEVAAEYPQIEKEHYIIDIGAARIASSPGRFDVIVTENLYGDIISDIAAEVSGSVGLAGSSNIGENFAMFEAIHGSAPDIAGKNIANPSGLLSAAVMMLVHIGQPEVAARVHNAWLATLESGIHTADVFNGTSKEKVGTKEFAQAVIAHLGKLPQTLKPISYKETADNAIAHAPLKIIPVTRELMGIDVAVYWQEDVETLANLLSGLSTPEFILQSISSKGLKLWPDHVPGMHMTDAFNCRYKKVGATISPANIATLFKTLADANIEWVKTEHLYNFDGKPVFSLGQGE